MYVRRPTRHPKPTSEPLARAKSLRKAPTPAESVLWQALRGRQVCGAKFRRQHSLGSFILSFWCPEYRLVIEVADTDRTPQEPGESSGSLERQCWLEAHQVHVVYVRSDEILYQLETVLLRITHALHQTGARRGG